MKCPRHPLFLTTESESATGTQELLPANLPLKRKDVPDESLASFEVGGSRSENKKKQKTTGNLGQKVCLLELCSALVDLPLAQTLAP